MKKLKEIWETDKKKAILFLLGSVLILLVIIILIFVIYNVMRRYSYQEIEEKLVESTQKYVKKHPEYLPSEDNPLMTIEASSLIGEKLLKDFSKLSRDTGCFGTVTLVWNANTILYTPTLECDHYQTKTIQDVILEYEEVLEETENKSGLYELNDFYTYRGEYVNNYINFAGYSWRIFKWDEEMLYLVLSDTVNNKVSYVYDDRYNETMDSNRGKNDFENSRISYTLNEIYENDFKDYHAYLLKMDTCVHSRSETDLDKSGAIECYTTYPSYFSLLAVYDYMNASLDPLCLTSTARNCSNYNYLSITKNRWWLLNGINTNSYQVYYADTVGKIDLESANGKKDLRPVIALSANSNYKTGNGSKEKPYEIALY